MVRRRQSLIGNTDRGYAGTENAGTNGWMAKKAPKSKSSKKSSEDAPTSFEAGLAEAQEIVRELESGELPLRESLQAYEVGVRRIRQCQELLSDFERRVELLTGFDKDGNPITQPFDDEDISLEEKQEARGRRRGAGGSRIKKTDIDDALF